MQQQGQLKYFPIDLGSLNVHSNPPSVVIRELKIKLPLYILSSNFMKASLHIVIWRAAVLHEEEEGIQAHPLLSEELGRIVMPVLGNYDSERPHLLIDEAILWNESNLAAIGIQNSTGVVDRVKASLTFQNGPRWIQLQNGSYSSYKGIEGNYFIGFPIPTVNDLDIDVKALDISNFIQEHALCVEQLKLAKYNAHFPQWFLVRQPNPHLLEHYEYEKEIVESKQEEETLSPDNNNNNNNNAIISGSSGDTAQILLQDFVNEREKMRTDRWHLLQMYEKNQLTMDEYGFACNELHKEHRSKIYDLQSKLEDQVAVLLATRKTQSRPSS
jgi:hypothetical protein